MPKIKGKNRRIKNMEYVYINGEVFAINLEEAENEDLNSLLDWIEERS